MPILRSSLRWFDWPRYSHRQDQAMLMGGLVGAITYQGNLGEYLPLLRFQAVFREVNQVCRRLAALGYAPPEIQVDFTSGTKAMSSGAVSAGIFPQCQFPWLGKNL